MSDLYSRLLAAVQAHKALAEAAVLLDGHRPTRDWTHDRKAVMAGEAILVQPNEWFGPTEVAAHIAANDPAFVIRACDRDLKVLQRHQLVDDHEDGDELWCNGCRGYDPPWPCIEIREIAPVYGIEVSDGR